MAWFVLAAWLVQSVVGATLLAGWVRHSPRTDGASRRGGALVAVHVLCASTALGCWVAFVGTHRHLFGWLGFGLLTVGNGVGDSLMVRRSRRLAGAGTSWPADYAAAIRNVFAGRLPARVTFHALFAGVVYFTALAACLMP